MTRPGQPALRTRTYEPAGAPRGCVLVTTGFGEHVGRYERICQAWQNAGYLIGAYDLRGQGQSEGRRGYVERFDDYIDDLLAVAEQFATRPDWRRPVLFGHSMGALICIHTALRAPGPFAGLVLTSPFLGLSLPAPKWKQVVARWMTSVWPTWAEPTGIEGAMVTRDRERARMIDDDPLRIAKMTVRLFVESERAQADAIARASELKVPVYCRAAELDKIASLATTRRFMAALGSVDKQLDVAVGQFHELHQEPEWAEHARLLAQQFERLLSESPAPAAATAS